MIKSNSRKCQKIITVLFSIIFTNVVFGQISTNKANHSISSDFIAFEFTKNEIKNNTNFLNEIYIPIKYNIKENEIFTNQIVELNFLGMEVENVLEYISMLNNFRLDKKSIPPKISKKQIWINIENKTIYSALAIITYPLGYSFQAKKINKEWIVSIMPNTKKTKNHSRIYIKLIPAISQNQTSKNKYMIRYNISE